MSYSWNVTVKKRCYSIKLFYEQLRQTYHFNVKQMLTFLSNPLTEMKFNL